MTLPRRAHLTLSALTMVLLFGLLGLAWWGWRYRSGYQPSARKHRVLTGLAIAGLVFIAVGTAGRLAAVFQPAPACTPPGGTQAPSRTARVDASLVAQQVATWPETGIGLLYSHASDGHVCLSTAADYYVAVHADNIAGTKAMTLGDIVLTPGFSISKEHLRRLIGHEAKHRVQWAAGTAIGGPFLFPVAYGIDDFFFPGSRNIFERQAGLTRAERRPASPRTTSEPPSRLDSHLGGARTLTLPGRIGPATRESAWKKSASESSHGGPAFR